METQHQTPVTAGLFVLIVGPSGAGKSAVVAELLRRHPQYVHPLSLTTRKQRPSEQHGKTYYFVTKSEFQKAVDHEWLLEWAVVHGKDCYGVLKQPIFDALSQNKVIVREVDIRGVRSIRRHIHKKNLLVIFLRVHDWRELKQRITRRAPISSEELRRRYLSYRQEIRAAKTVCDMVLYNETGKLSQTIQRIEQVVDKRFKKAQNDS